MTKFINPDFAAEHGGVVRLEAFAATVSDWKRNFNGSRSLATLMLAAIVAALVVVADQLVDAWADEHLFAAWVALWTLVFATLAVFAPVAKRLVAEAAIGLDAYRANLKTARDEAEFLASAQQDPRVMAELQAAILRHEAAQIEALGTIEPNVALDRVMNMLPPSKRYLRYI